MRPMGSIWLAVAGCYLQWDGYDGKPGKRPGAEPDAYDALVERLDRNKTRFGGETIGEMWTAGARVYWLEYQGWDPTLHSFDTETGAAANYAGTLPYQRSDVRVSEEAVATVTMAGGNVTYRVVAADEPTIELSTLTVPQPPGAERWWAFAVDGQDLYYLTTGARTTLHRVRPGGQPETLTTLESAGIEVGELWDFGIDDGLLVVVESGRLWSLELETREVRWLGNERQVDGQVTFDAHGVLFTTYDGSMDAPFYYAFAQHKLIDLAAAIAEIQPEIPGLSETAHFYSEDIARWGKRFVYGGNTGLFLYDPAHGSIEPVLMEPRTGIRVDYRYPVVTENGVLFVTGLESESGAVGADGPIWRVDLEDL